MKTLSTTEMLTVEIQPLNEGQELNYCETFEGTLADLIARCLVIQHGLQKLLPKGDFSVKLTNWSTNPETEYTYHEGTIYDSDNNRIFDLHELDYRTQSRISHLV